ncbi:MAG TPA: 23S rRNA (adenine(2503)-C(2))-methyltransferase RlmN [Kiritimatiellia bacterium]|jgi:23S rRNA (adenine2503-C2)-methyltransferase|nr:23S rRNA (adenine(2503)-C(2))-methyltransferase RlmN [Kiritimatiellia bacterium]OQC60245.1 MAG: putative dual-specificity RNA methyltransferase RlmN [Verrucomicrobia bacterium ADurb.Bin018]HPV46236.1 23S rRNA (adenine(2503)-C(2))-methyltransferase RlmN [Kiritimatiellia bacterium]HQF21650.1 23S rRNA (adenine(2503)-C(2))-methyltransferase RlmN [Kiritimatiellia bacterium]HQG75765.1 23S rRNA (adenine(2503)-C(2))-methyltransferase RlmN [Kiritimatiellia bacterium]
MLARQMKTALQGLWPEELQALALAAGQPAFRAKQLWQWVQVRGATRWEQMGNLPAAWKSALAATHTPEPIRIIKETADAGGTRKWLGGLDDGECVETVLIPARDWTTVCLSTQVGCRMGCAFCASAKGGFARSLSAGEIVGQFQLVMAATGRRPDNVVYMGMGEPFDNYDEVLKSIRILNHPDGLNIGARRITISTSGVIPGIRRLAGEGLQVELSVSLHAVNHELRRQLMPIENKYPLTELLAACRDYTAATKRFVTFEYTLIRGVNDSARDAEELAKHLRPFSCRVNLIPLSPVPEFAGEAPTRVAIEQFQQTLAARGVSVTLRESKGKDVNAACGQLRRQHRLPQPSD